MQRTLQGLDEVRVVQHLFTLILGYRVVDQSETLICMVGAVLTGLTGRTGFCWTQIGVTMRIRVAVSSFCVRTSSHGAAVAGAAVVRVKVTGRGSRAWQLGACAAYAQVIARFGWAALQKLARVRGAAVAGVVEALRGLRAWRGTTVVFL